MWYKEKSSPEVDDEYFTEDLAYPIQLLQACKDDNIPFPYNFEDIDTITSPLGVPWEKSKEIHFGYTVPFIGFTWDLLNKTISLPQAKKEKYLQSITEWRMCETHTLKNVQWLYGKLLYMCLIVPKGQAHLTNLEKMMSMAQPRPFVPQDLLKSLDEDLTWWQNLLPASSLHQAIPGG